MAKIAVIGPGAIGGVTAAALAQAGHELVICANQSFDSLSVVNGEGAVQWSGPVKVLTDPAKAQPADWVLLAVKSHQTESAAGWLKATVGERSKLAVLQNGVEHAARAAPYIPDGTPVVPVVLQLPAERTSPGQVRLTAPAVFISPDDAAGREFAALFGAGFVTARTDPDFVSRSWEKLCLNAPSGALCAITLVPDAIGAVEGMQELAHAIIGECMAVGRAEGATFAPEFQEKLLKFLTRPVNRGNSMYYDRRDGKKMEWDARNGVIQRLGRKHGVPTPATDVLVPILKALDPA